LLVGKVQERLLFTNSFQRKARIGLLQHFYLGTILGKFMIDMQIMRYQIEKVT